MAQKEKTAFLFSGQGSQYTGMGKEFYDNIPACKKILDTACGVLGTDLAEIMFNAEPERLARTTVSQPAILAVSLMALEAVRERGIDACAVAGHSLGEYAAMTAAGMLSIEQAFKAIKLRSEAMDKAAKLNPGCMSAIMGLPAADIARICTDIAAGGDYVSAVNFNSDAQTVIAGSAEGVAKAEEALKAAGARRAVRLAVSAAFHSEFMRGAADEFKQKIADFDFKPANIAFYSNLKGERLNDFSDMPSYLSQHICSPVRFTDELRAMQSSGIDTFIELGPGKVLTGLVKKTLSDVTAINVEDVKTLESAV